jgi:hypothetical protein
MRASHTRVIEQAMHIHPTVSKWLLTMLENMEPL